MTPLDFAPTYRFRGTVTRVIDGDTIRVLLTLPFHQFSEVDLRLARIDTPELDEPGGKEARAVVVRLVDGREVWVETFKERRTFLRYVSECWYDADPDGDLLNLSDQLMELGVATRRW